MTAKVIYSKTTYIYYKSVHILGGPKKPQNSKYCETLNLGCP